MSFIPPPPDRDDIDFGTDPARTTKSITMKITESTQVKDKNLGGMVQKYTSTIEVHIFVRDITMRGIRTEPQDLIDLEKYVIEYIALNRLAFVSQGISNIQILAVDSSIDETYAKQGVWYHTVVTLEAHYYLAVS